MQSENKIREALEQIHSRAKQAEIYGRQINRTEVLGVIVDLSRDALAALASEGQESGGPDIVGRLQGQMQKRCAESDLWNVLYDGRAEIERLRSLLQELARVERSADGRLVYIHGRAVGMIASNNLATPPQESGEPIAWLYSNGMHRVTSLARLTEPERQQYGWSKETPLYAAHSTQGSETDAAKPSVGNEIKA